MHQPQRERISLADFLTWEQGQCERHEWIDGTIVPCAGVSADHGMITANLIALFHAAVGAGSCFVQPPDRQLVPRDEHNNDLGSFYADVFVSCAPEDRTGSAAHFPTVVVEVVSKRVGEEFLIKRQAYLKSARLLDYLIIDSRSRYAHRYSWKVESATKRRRLGTAEQAGGSVVIPSLNMRMTFDQIYANSSVPVMLSPIATSNAEETEIIFS